MYDSKDLVLLIKSRVPLIVIETRDERRALNLLIENTVQLRDYHAVHKWSITEGLQRIDIALEPQRFNADPAEALRHILSVERPGIYVLLDFHPYLKDPMHVRLIKDLCLRQDPPRTLILLSHSIEVPAELEHFSARFELSLPDETERERIVREVAAEWVKDGGKTVKTDASAFERLISNLAGLTAPDTRRLARNAIYNDGAISHNDVERVMRAKHELLNRNGLLAYEYETAQFSEVGGLRRLKHWLETRRQAFLDDSRTTRLDPPDGLLLIGVQGCGKSLSAKATAGILGIPLVRLDFGSLYDKYHGESERRLRNALETAEVVAPCVLWIDEIEKGIASSDTDGGTSRRLLGYFLTWLAEKQARVFVVATANDISSLPPELIRKGRFDEIFFVDLPGHAVRQDIFAVHLRKRGIDPQRFDLGQLAEASRGFSGAEIEQAVVAALYRAHAEGGEMTGAHVLEELRNTSPLSVVMAEQLQALRDWASERAVSAD